MLFRSVQLATRPNAALTFGWLAAHRQVRVRGEVERVREIDADAYFASRPRGSQVGAWASPQSQVIANRAVLDDLVAAQEQRFANDPIPRPSFWGGWRVVPSVMEFWQGRSSRLHDRIRYRLEGQDWLRERLAP